MTRVDLDAPEHALCSETIARERNGRTLAEEQLRRTAEHWRKAEARVTELQRLLRRACEWLPRGSGKTPHSLLDEVSAALDSVGTPQETSEGAEDAVHGRISDREVQSPDGPSPAGRPDSGESAPARVAGEVEAWHRGRAYAWGEVEAVAMARGLTTFAKEAAKRSAEIRSLNEAGVTPSQELHSEIRKSLGEMLASFDEMVTRVADFGARDRDGIMSIYRQQAADALNKSALVAEREKEAWAMVVRTPRSSDPVTCDHGEAAKTGALHCRKCDSFCRYRGGPWFPMQRPNEALPFISGIQECDDDRPLPEDEQIKAAHPMRTDRHDLYQEAMRLVGAKHSKGALVELVNWLLLRIDDVQTAATLTIGSMQKQINEQRSETAVAPPSGCIDCGEAKPIYRCIICGDKEMHASAKAVLQMCIKDLQEEQEAYSEHCLSEIAAVQDCIDALRARLTGSES